MRDTLVVVVALLGVSGALGAEKPIPQDPVKSERWRRELLEWNRRSMVGAYDKVGKKDPKWDKAAREALELGARSFCLQIDPPVTFAEVHVAAKAAVDAGCDDPYVVYLYHRSAVGPDYPGADEAIRRMKAAAKAIADSRYPAFRRAGVIEKAGTYTVWNDSPNEAARADAQRDFDASLALLRDSVSSDERSQFWEDRWYENFLDLLRGYRKIGMDGPSAYERVDKGLADILELKVLRLQVRGFFWYGFGWEARTTAFAPNVPAGGFETFEKHVKVTKEALDEAWKLRPDDPRTANLRFGIEKAIGGGDRDAMELWFDRAMRADPDDYVACWEKLDWLDPKWYGTIEEMLAFGKACQATGNWRAKITLLAADAHFRAGGKRPPAELVNYMSAPEVWNVVHEVYTEYLKHYPDDDVERSKYATLCYLCRRYDEAHVEFERLGDRLTTWPKFPNYPLAALQRYRSDMARYAASRAAAKDAGDGAAKP